MGPVDVQLDAYNRRDLERFLAQYSPRVRAEDATGQVTLDGADAFRTRYAKLFADSPSLHCTLLNRIHVGPWTFDEERITGIQAEGLPPELHAVIAYHVNDGKIDVVRMHH